MVPTPPPSFSLIPHLLLIPLQPQTDVYSARLSFLIPMTCMEYLLKNIHTKKYHFLLLLSGWCFFLSANIFFGVFFSRKKCCFDGGVRSPFRYVVVAWLWNDDFVLASEGFMMAPPKGFDVCLFVCFRLTSNKYYNNNK